MSIRDPPLKNPSFAAVIFLVILLSSISISGFSSGFASASDASGIIGSDTTWTKAGSPYTLTGNVLVANGAALTIEAGVTIHLNTFYIMVNGSLQAKGTASDRIVIDISQLDGGHIEFTSYSQSWNSAIGTGSYFEYTTATAVYGNNISLKISNCNIRGLSVGASSTIRDSTLHGIINVGTRDTLITNNVIEGEIIGTSPTITYNQITGGGGNTGYEQTLDTSAAIAVKGSATIKNNVINGTVTGESLTITNNVIAGGGITTEPPPFSRQGPLSSAIYVTGPSTIEYNTVSSPNGGYGITTKGGTVSHNTISHAMVGIQGATQVVDNIVTYCDRGISGRTEVRNNTVANNNIGINLINGGTAENNVVVNNNWGIASDNQATIKNNIISSGWYGIKSGGNVLIESNLVANCSIAAVALGDAIPEIQTGTVQKNTLIDSVNAIAVWTYNQKQATIDIAYNNILRCSQNTIRLFTTNDVNASNNWWGTTDTQTISQTIYDYYKDFTLGRVNINPILTALNTAAPSPDTFIPNQPSPITNPTPTIQPTDTPSPTQQKTTTASPTPPSIPENFDTIMLVAIAVLTVIAVLAIILLLNKKKGSHPR
jgi:hypothetical protein